MNVCRLRNVYSYNPRFFKEIMLRVYKEKKRKFILEEELKDYFQLRSSRMISDLLQFMKNSLGMIKYMGYDGLVLLTPRGLRMILPVILHNLEGSERYLKIENQYFRYATWLNLIDLDRKCFMSNIMNFWKYKKKIFRDEHRQAFHSRILDFVFEGVNLTRFSLDELDPYNDKFNYELIFNRDVEGMSTKVLCPFEKLIKLHKLIRKKIFGGNYMFLNIYVLKGIAQIKEITQNKRFLNEATLEREMIRMKKQGILEFTRGAGGIKQEGRGIILGDDHYLYYYKKKKINYSS